MSEWLAQPVEHVGSTAVPGRASKPIVDILAPITSLMDAQAAVPLLEEDGWRHWPSDPNGSWRSWFLRPRPEARTHHLYLIQYDHPRVAELRAFRDALRADGSLRDRYEALKRNLANEFRDDREAYTNAKAGFVADVLRVFR
ncbi:GrpB family protein [Mycobacterium sp. OAS707]|uniref:GrpB family protein n=1 Tax=Mycobacterium sp. OAS707 TaxID=2663822 RepID=UPI00178904EF|nr:GrpB family protein [Mycobacterium sp. OAS707]